MIGIVLVDDFRERRTHAGLGILTASAAPGKIYKGTLRAIDRVVNSETRTLRARAEIVNTDGTLRPEMYLDAVIHVPSGRKLSVPVAAVIDTGTRQVPENGEPARQESVHPPILTHRLPAGEAGVGLARGRNWLRPANRAECQTPRRPIW